MPGRRGVEHDEALPRLRDEARERVEDRHLLGARGAEVLGEQRAALGVERGALAAHHALRVGARLRGGVDTAHLEVRDRASDGGRDVRRRIGGAEVDVEPAPGQLDGDRGGDRRLSDAALAHHHHEPVTGGGELVDERVKPDELARQRSAGRRRDGVEVAVDVVTEHARGASRCRPCRRCGAEPRTKRGPAAPPACPRARRRRAARSATATASSRSRARKTRVDDESLVLRRRGARSSTDVRAASRRAASFGRVTSTIVRELRVGERARAPPRSAPDAS